MIVTLGMNHGEDDNGDDAKDDAEVEDGMRALKMAGGEERIVTG